MFGGTPMRDQSSAADQRPDCGAQWLGVRGDRRYRSLSNRTPLIMTSQTSRPVIRLALAMLVGSGGRVLLVRKRGTSVYMQPGGKIEHGEEPVVALVRELHEELGIVVSVSSPQYVGRFSAPAANEPNADIDADVFKVAVIQEIQAQAEIEEAIWVDPLASLDLNLAPLTRTNILPAYRQMLEGSSRRTA